ncbi:PREDICTED: uncharacterized protein LOC104744713 isoform X2 [Camelina sativa]|uniref:Uncharacterized protein LOC104744713 isoform X2 n=1 Tax=Camelina sativa TaxID=90675 RepID=A0ABM1R0C1_CAMSA|nr:PREDICTED: uncharacterized protein LOC104744713 isoform X2 [Camelina sativa]
METTEPMEESSRPVASASVTKRKAESDTDIEDSDDENKECDDEVEESGDEEYVDSDDELMKPTWWTVPEWDVDSFEGLEYHSSQEENELSDQEAEGKWRRYKRLVVESKGFYVEPGLRPRYCFSGIKPVSNLEFSAGFGQTYREYFAEMACLCLQKYNQEKSEINVEFVEVVRGNYTTGSRSKSYITFMAREKPDGPLVEYQAKVWCTFVQHENYPILCRPAPTQSLGTKFT